jgi:hypothetical protein
MPGDGVSKSMVESYHEILPDKLTPAAARYFPSNTEIVAVISGVILLLLFMTLEKHAFYWFGLEKDESVATKNGDEPLETMYEESGEQMEALPDRGDLKEDRAPEEKYPQAGEGLAKSSS